MKEFRLPLTPITSDTFIRQGWKCINVNDLYEDVTSDDTNDGDSNAHYWMIPLPKHRTDEYTTYLMSNSSDDNKMLKQQGLKPGQYFVEIMDADGLGFCKSEEELEILYKALTHEDINDTSIK
jgi:hypothetical protein